MLVVRSVHPMACRRGGRKTSKRSGNTAFNYINVHIFIYEIALTVKQAPLWARAGGHEPPSSLLALHNLATGHRPIGKAYQQGEAVGFRAVRNPLDKLGLLSSRLHVCSSNSGNARSSLPNGRFIRGHLSEVGSACRGQKAFEFTPGGNLGCMGNLVLDWCT